MRTKTLALSALMGALGSASLIAQTNVYSLNAVGYINVTLPPGYSMVTCPLQCTPDNSLNTCFNDATNAYDGASVQAFNNGGSFGNGESAAFGSWSAGGTTVNLTPGSAVFFYNPADPRQGAAGNMYATFVGTVPQGSLTNKLYPGYNLVGSVVPVSGDAATNSVMNNFGFGATGPGNGDSVVFYDPTANAGAPPIYQNGYTGPGTACSWQFGSWIGGLGNSSLGQDPIVNTPTTGFFYYNAQGAGNTEQWIENFTINP
jgi:hypothetical protein